MGGDYALEDSEWPRVHRTLLRTMLELQMPVITQCTPGNWSPTGGTENVFALFLFYTPWSGSL